MSLFFYQNIDNLIIDGNKFSLVNISWKDISGLRVSQKIASTIDGGVAIISEDYLPQNNYVECEIISPFSKTTYTSSEWGLQYPTYIDAFIYQDQFKSSELLSLYLKAISDNFLEVTNETINRFSKLRDLDNMDFDYLVPTLRTLGFQLDMTSGDNIFDPEIYRRTLREAINFYNISGTKYTLSFLSYVQNTFIGTEELYTSDYNFFNSSPLDETYYLTSRINVLLDVINYNTPRDIAKLQDVFYKLAPINIMINYFLGKYLAPTSLSIVGVQDRFNYKNSYPDTVKANWVLQYDNGTFSKFDNDQYFGTENNGLIQ